MTRFMIALVACSSSLSAIVVATIVACVITCRYWYAGRATTTTIHLLVPFVLLHIIHFSKKIKLLHNIVKETFLIYIIFVQVCKKRYKLFLAKPQKSYVPLLQNIFTSSSRD
jgi:hypothetical protein